MALTDSLGCILSAQHAGPGHRAPAVQRQVDAGDEARLLAGQVDHGVGHVVGRAEPGEVHGPELLAALRGQFGIAPFVQHVARTDGVAPHAGAGVVDGDGPGQGVQPSLTGRVGGEARGAALAGAGRDVDNRAVTDLDHLRDGGPAQSHHCGQVDQEDVVPRIVGDVGDRGVPRRVGRGGVVHQHAEPAAVVHRLGHERSDGRVVGEIGGDETGVTAAGPDRCGHGLTPVLAATGHDHRGALAGASLGQMAAQARRGTGDDDHLTCEASTGRHA
jgi:hypothetical protein